MQNNVEVGQGKMKDSELEGLDNQEYWIWNQRTVLHKNIQRAAPLYALIFII